MNIKIHNKNINNLCPKPDCDKYVFLNPKIAVLAVVQKDNEILLVKRNIMPFYNEWSLPAGYINKWEAPDKAIIREVYEETNVKIKVLKLLDAHLNEDSGVIVLSYLTKHLKGPIKIGEECKDVKYFKFNQLPKLPFENDNQLIKLLIRLILELIFVPKDIFELFI